MSGSLYQRVALCHITDSTGLRTFRQCSEQLECATNDHGKNTQVNKIHNLLLLRGK